MDAKRFDTLVKSFSAADTRRGLLRVLASVPLGLTLTAFLGPETTQADGSGAIVGGGGGRRRRRQARHRHDPGQHQDRDKANGKEKRKDKRKGKRKKTRRKTTPSQPPPIFAFKADPMTGANEVPPVATTGTGSAQFTIQGSTICGTFQASGLSGSVTTKHIHPGVAGAEGSFVVDFSASELNERQCVPCPGTVCADIKANPAAFYANIHTTTRPDGEVRAQLQAV